MCLKRLKLPKKTATVAEKHLQSKTSHPLIGYGHRIESDKAETRSIKTRRE